MTGRRGLKRIALAAGAVDRRVRRSRPRAVGLCYHSVHADKPFATAEPVMFERQIAWLTEHCEVLPLTAETIRAAREPRHDRPVVFLTFDDGYDDNHEVVLPILLRYGITASFYLTTGFIDRDAQTLARFRRERACGDELLRPLSWTQIQELHSAGMVVGAHGHTHANLATLDPTAVRMELQTSRAVIEDRLGVAVTTMAYPYGKPRVHFNERTMTLARDTGYDVAAAVTSRGVRPADSDMRIPRFFVARDDVATLRDKVEGTFDVISVWQEFAPRPLLQAMSPLDFSH